MHGILMVSNADGSVVFRDGVWLSRYEPDENDGAGGFDFTDDPDEALRYPDAAAASAEWRRVSVTRPLRLDGRPNRPLSAFTIEIRKLPEKGSA